VRDGAVTVTASKVRINEAVAVTASKVRINEAVAVTAILGPVASPLRLVGFESA
jgi:hypothetical protein